MEMRNVLFEIFGLPVTLYAALLVCAFAAGLLLLHMNQRKAGLAADTAEIFALLALPLGLVGARVFYVLARLPLYMEIGLGNVLRLWDGGFALWGAVGGAVVAAILTAKITKQSAVKLLDALAAPAALTIAIARFAEFASGEGIGLEVESELLQFFPLAVFDAEWEVWFYAIFMAEGVAALIICALLQWKAFPRTGDKAKLFFVLYCSVQILLESLRRDQFLRWLFVRVSQLTAVLVLGGLMFYALYKWAKAAKEHRMPVKPLVINWVIFLLGVGICIAMEFAVDKSADMPVWLCYCIMAVCCVAFGWTSCKLVLHSVKE